MPISSILIDFEYIISFILTTILRGRYYGCFHLSDEENGKKVRVITFSGSESYTPKFECLNNEILLP